MPEDSLQFYKEREALQTLIHSEEFGQFCESGNYHSLQSTLQEYLDDLCVHNWRITKEYEDDDYVLQECKNCGAERETIS